MVLAPVPKLRPTVVDALMLPRVSNKVEAFVDRAAGVPRIHDGFFLAIGVKRKNGILDGTVLETIKNRIFGSISLAFDTEPVEPSYFHRYNKCLGSVSP